ncbi:MAG: hypothetical protein J5617_01355 [Bacilli bacterium]|nr:hypothetical protein [Bacilli bacterium]
MAIMTAINLVFIVLDTFVPFMMLLLILLLPFVSAVVSYFCQKRYYIIYAVASVGLCLIFNIADTIFYIIPALCSGFVIGLLLDRKINPFWMILSSTLIEVALTYAFIPLINLMTNTDMVVTFLTIFHLNEFAYKEELMHLFILFIALTQCSITHFVLLSEIKKMGVETDTRVASFVPYIIGLFACLTIGTILAFTYKPLSLAFVALSFYFAIFLLVDIILSKRISGYVILGVSMLAAFILFVIFFTKIEKPMGFMLFGLFPLAIGLTSFFENILLNRKDNN